MAKKRPSKPNFISKEPKVNPFELRHSRQKHSVIGRKVKGAVGKPGIARSRSNQIRNETLLQEWKKGSRQTSFIDKRIGEGNAEMSLEDKLLERFVSEKRRAFTRQSRAAKNSASMISNGSDKLQLTHYGQALSDIRFDSEVNLFGDDSDDDVGGKIDEDTVAQTHFGGFEDDSESQKKSRKQIMQEVMAKSKYYKYERQRVRQENDDLRQTMDDDLDSVRLLLKEYETQNEMSKSESSKNDDDYDKVMRELAFDRRARPTDKMQTETELIKQQAEKLKALAESDSNQPQVRYLFTFPESTESLFEQLAPYASDLSNLSTALGRMRVLFHPRLSLENLERLPVFFQVMWDSVAAALDASIFANAAERMAYIDLAAHHFADFTREYPSQFTKVVLSFMRADAVNCTCRFIYYQIIFFLYPAANASEIKEHPITTKVQEQLGLCMAKQIHQLREITPQAAAEAVLMLQFWLFGTSSTSPLFYPEGFNLLNFMLLQFVSTSQSSLHVSFPVATSLKSWVPPLLLAEKKLLAKIDGNNRASINYLLSPPTQFDEEYKQFVLCSLLKLVERLLLCTKSALPSFPELFTDTVALLGLLSDGVPKKLRLRIDSLAKSIALAIKSCLALRKPLQLQKFKPIPIATFAPKFEEQYSLDRHKSSYGKTREQLEGEKLKQALKKEKQGALRELRKDAAYLHRAQLDKVRKADKQYKEKIGRIVGQLGDQEGEAKKMDKMKKKRF